MIEYECPRCGTEFSFRKRVTLTKRYCPHCNKLVTTKEIDKQLEQQELELMQDEINQKRISYYFGSALFVIVVPLFLFMLAGTGTALLFSGISIPLGVFTALSAYQMQNVID